MTLTEFDNGYWYATELKKFAETIGFPSAGELRKDELEKAIRLFLKTGEIKNPAKRNLSMAGIKDIQRGLRLDLPVVFYTNDKETRFVSFKCRRSRYSENWITTSWQKRTRQCGRRHSKPLAITTTHCEFCQRRIIFSSKRR